MFYGDIEKIVENIPKYDTTILLGDFNLNIRKEECFREFSGKETIHEIPNDNGKRLCNFAALMNMKVSRTKYKHKTRHKET